MRIIVFRPINGEKHIINLDNIVAIKYKKRKIKFYHQDVCFQNSVYFESVVVASGAFDSITRLMIGSTGNAYTQIDIQCIKIK